jgi:hypothetical protein
MAANAGYAHFSAHLCQRRWQQALLLSVRLRQAARLLMVIYASAIVASALPLQLLSSRWYLNAACLRLIAG